MTRWISLCGAVGAVLIYWQQTLLGATEVFPFDRELLLEAAPIPPGKRMPILTVEANGNASIDLWCRTVTARLEISETALKIVVDQLPEELPAMQSAGQCTADRIKADEDMLAAFEEVTGWSREGEFIILRGPTNLRFRASDH
ncbi:MAG TPA: hypothetical protein VFP60_04965 [Pseudolabrys sp.]|nr:hypothetical protein [Pseudolabrys sp.]